MLTKEALSKAMQWCSRKECCSKEMYDKVISWGCTPEEAGEIMEALIREKFIDDRRYTEAYVHDKLKFNKWGKVKISYMLQMQGVNSVIIDEVISGIDDRQYEEILKNEITKKYKSIRNGDIYEVKNKLYRFAAGKGFESDTISKVLKGVITN